MSRDLADFLEDFLKVRLFFSFEQYCLKKLENFSFEMVNKASKVAVRDPPLTRRVLKKINSIKNNSETWYILETLHVHSS